MGARRGRPTVAVELSGAEREVLERWARRTKSPQAELPAQEEVPLEAWRREFEPLA